MALLKSDTKNEPASPRGGKVKIDVGDGQLIPDRADGSILSAWNIAFFGALSLLVILPVVKPDPYLRIIRFIPDGVLVTFQVTVTSILFSVVIGLFTGLGRISRIAFINRLATVYVEVIRGIPLLVQLFYIYFALGGFLQLPPMASAITAMSICYGAYMGEISEPDSSPSREDNLRLPWPSVSAVDKLFAR